MQDLVIHDTPIAPGTDAIVRIPIAQLPTGTAVDLPVHVYRAEADGLCLLLQGGLHGDELNGVEILRRMVADGSCRPTRGTVLVVPVLNLFGFLAGSRELPDGKDINRSFPGSARGSLASRVAHAHMTHVFPPVNVAIDFHTGGGRRHNEPQVRFTEGDADSEALAEVFAAPYRFATKPIPRSFRREAAKRDVPVLVYEAGETLRFDERAIAEGIAGARRVMVHLGIADEAPAPGPSLAIGATRWVRSPKAGLFSPAVAPGQVVDKGDALGTITDPYNIHVRTVSAPTAGHVICLNQLPLVHRGDALIRIGRPAQEQP